MKKCMLVKLAGAASIMAGAAVIFHDDGASMAKIIGYGLIFLPLAVGIAGLLCEYESAAKDARMGATRRADAREEQKA